MSPLRNVFLEPGTTRPAVKHIRDDEEETENTTTTITITHDTTTVAVAADVGVQRSMARRKKNEPPMDINKKCPYCDKVFKRPCDYTKHEKTHVRPWKCPEHDCKYFTLGWPTEKERDRHVNDRHSANPPEYQCKYPPCTYTSKRESNCKQHMEKSHGWQYVRSKNNAKRTKLSPGQSPSASSGITTTPSTPAMSTPISSLGTELPSPASGTMISPYVQTVPHDTPINYDPAALLDGYYNMNTGEPFNFADPPATSEIQDFTLFPDSDINAFANVDMNMMGLGALPTGVDYQHLNNTFEQAFEQNLQTFTANNFGNNFDTAMASSSDHTSDVEPPTADMSLDQLGQDHLDPYCFDNDFLNNYQNTHGGF